MIRKLRNLELQRPDKNAFQQLKKLPVKIALDNVRSALNVGSVFRSADGFCMEGLILGGISAKPPHAEIRKTALGATETVTWEYAADLLACLKTYKAQGWKLVALEQTAPKIWLQDWEPAATERYIFILGNEVEGVSPALLACCDYCIEIPQGGTKHSLNVAVAAGILMWEAYKKIGLPV